MVTSYVPYFLILPLLVAGVMSLDCESQRLGGGGRGRIIYYSPYSSNGPWNLTIGCPSTFTWEWTVARVCCYDNYDRFYEHPYCCYSEMYKLVVAVGFICLTVLGVAFLVFFCWLYNLPHHILYILTFRKFLLNDWLLKIKGGNGPYVDPSYYLKEPFWSRNGGGSGFPYPLRPMPPRIFYPVPPANRKFRGWDMGGGDVPLFILASRQFHRNPYSARPNEGRTPHHSHSDSRRSSLDEEVGGGGGGSRVGSTSSSVMRRDSRQSGGHGHPPLQGTNSSRRPSTSTSNSQVVALQSNSHHHHGNLSSSILSTHHEHHHHHVRSAPPPDTFVVVIDEEEAKQELRDAIRLMDSKDVNNGETDPSPYDPPGVGGVPRSSSVIFMTNASAQMEIEAEARRRNSIAESGVGLGGLGGGGKISVHQLNQQLSSSLGLSLSNLPNIQVVGNFVGPSGVGGGGIMETIEDEDEDEGEEGDEDEFGDEIGKLPTPKRNIKNPPPPPHRVASAFVGVGGPDPMMELTTLPGSVPDKGDVKGKRRLDRRNSAPVNF